MIDKHDYERIEFIREFTKIMAREILIKLPKTGNLNTMLTTAKRIVNQRIDHILSRTKED